MRNEIKKILSMLLIGIMFGAIPAAALTGTTDWDGKGAEKLGTCNSDEEPYLHWVFTKDGYTLGSVMLTIVVNGVETTVEMKEHSKGSYTYDAIGSYDPDTLAGTHVDFEVLSSGDGNLVLTISDGCTGVTEIPEFPSIALPMAAIIGLLFLFNQRKTRADK